MEEPDKEQKLIRRYLLGEPGPERERIEQRMLTDPAYFERVLMTEDEMFNDFVFSDMSVPERRDFAKHLLSTPGQVRKLEITKALKDHSANARASGFGWLLGFTSEHKLGAGFAFATMLLLGLLAGYIALSYDPLQREMARLNARPGGPAQPGQPVLVVTLTPARFRGPGDNDGEKQLTIAPADGFALFQLALPRGEDYESYGVTIPRGGGAKPIHVEGLKPVSVGSATVLPVLIPLKLLTAGQHQLTLDGVMGDGRRDQSIDTYTFRVANDKR